MHAVPKRMSCMALRSSEAVHVHERRKLERRSYTGSRSPIAARYPDIHAACSPCPALPGEPPSVERVVLLLLLLHHRSGEGSGLATGSYTGASIGLDDNLESKTRMGNIAKGI